MAGELAAELFLLSKSCGVSWQKTTQFQQKLSMSEPKRSETAEAIPDAALDYLARGWAPVPIAHGEKGPCVPNWPDVRLGEADLPAHFSNGENVGVILGEASHGLADVDLYCAESL